MPFAIKNIIRAEPDQLEVAAVIQRMSYSEWDTPTVAIPKRDGMCRICGDLQLILSWTLINIPFLKQMTCFPHLQAVRIFPY